MFNRAVIKATKLKYVPRGTEVTIEEMNAVTELWQYFAKDPTKSRETTDSMSVGSITFIGEKGDEHAFNFGLFEWSPFGSKLEYPLPENFHTRLKAIIKESTGKDSR